MVFCGLEKVDVNTGAQSDIGPKKEHNGCSFCKAMQRHGKLSKKKGTVMCMVFVRIIENLNKRDVYFVYSRYFWS